MSANIADLLKNRSYDEPPEVTAIKKFLKDEFDATGTVALRDHQVIITVSSAALAGSLRLKMPELQKIVQTNKKLVIRIG